MKRITITQFAAYWLLLCPIFCMAQDRHTDSLALAALYNATDSIDWTLTEPLDSLEGVILDETGRVSELRLSDKNIIGNLPPEIGNLTNLTELRLANNQLSGNIPSEIGNLASLKELRLFNNQLSGNIPPEIGNLINLEQLRLYGNQLTGNIPPEIGNLTNLTWLNLAVNELSADIPPEIGNLTNLTLLKLSKNQFSGNIPPELGNLVNLTTFELQFNQFSNNIPSEIGNLTNLTALRLFENELTGNIPPEIGNLTNLTVLKLHDNQLSGCYDNNLMSLCNQLSNPTNGNISNGNNFDASWEDFCASNCGICFSDDTQCNMNDWLALKALYESTDGDNWINNDGWEQVLSDTPPNCCNLDDMYGVVLNESGRVKDLSLLSNELTGNIPPEIGNLDSLEVLNFRSNQLNGNIPVEIGNLTKLRVLSLVLNEIDGNIPAELGDLTHLTHLLLASNDLNGNIPIELNNLSELTYLNFSSNELTGTIPAELGNLTMLTDLRLSENQLSGSIPAEIGDLINLEKLYFQSNNLSGNIPTELGGLHYLRILYLLRNKLSGSIPTTLADLSNIEQVRLEFNELSDTIPDFSGLQHLHQLHLNYNNFSHQDIAINFSNNNNDDGFIWDPQYYGNEQIYIDSIIGTEIILSPDPPIPYDNLEVRWLQNDEFITDNYSLHDTTYLISSLEPSNVGIYQYRFTDYSLPNPVVEFHSRPIYVIIPGYDLLGQPVVYNQIMMEFDSEADKIEYEEKYVYRDRVDLAATVKDSCDCNRLLYLWDFPNDSIALKVFLEVNTRRESIGQRRTRVDGGLNNIFNIGPIASGEGWTWTGDYSDDYPDSVSVFLLDSGADTLWDASPYLLNDAPVDSCYNLPMSSGFDYTDSLTTINVNFADSLGHGTYGFRSIAEGLSDNNINLKVVPLKVFDKEGEGTLFNFVCALYHAIDHGADIIHVSAGYTGAASVILENAIALSKEKGCLLVTAAGNDGRDIDIIPQYPASYAKEFHIEGYTGNDSLVHYDNIISVASINPQDELSVFSSHGDSSVLIAAYGEDMSGYSHTGEKISSSGTSVSAFYVTRELAVEIAKNRNRTYEQIWQDFETNALRDCPATEGLTKTGKCLDITLNEVYANLRVYLEGTYDTTMHKMRNDLNMRHLLPGQTPGDATLNYDLAIQPYSTISPYYQGNESVPGVFTNYPDEVVDWILVSLRAEKSADTEVGRTAAWLLDNGNIQLLQPLLEDVHSAPDSAYVVIEHRNHLWTMSPEKIPVNNILTWNFTTQDGYTTPAATGQIQLQSGVWAMLAGDGEQDDIGGGDINAADKIIWLNDNGKFLLYLKGDYNLNGDTNGEDKWMWERNNGIFSGIPK